jgi:AmpE protein
MEFLAALIAVMLVQLWGSGAPLHRDDWFLLWCRKCASLPAIGGMSTLLPVFAISVPVFALLIVYYGVADEGWGLPKLAILVVILLYSFGRGDFRNALENYAQAWRAGDIDAARRLLRGFECSLPDVTDALPQLHAQARSRVLYRGFERMFAVLFWFTVAGPALALAYRLAFLYRYRVAGAGITDDNRLAVALADQVLLLFEWLPVRALGISFVVVGNIRDGVRTWLDLLQRHGSAPIAYLEAICSAVSGFQDPETMLADSHSESAFVTRADDELRQLQVLLNRSLVLWLAMMALLQVVL